MKEYDLPFNFLGLKIKSGCFYEGGHPESNRLIKKGVIEQIPKKSTSQHEMPLFVGDMVSITISGPKCGIAENASIVTVLDCWQDLNRNVICFLPIARERTLKAYVFSSPEDLIKNQYLLNQKKGVRTWYYVNDIDLLQKEFESNQEESSFSNSNSSDALVDNPLNMLATTPFGNHLNFIKANPESLVKAMLTTEGEYKKISFLYLASQNTNPSNKPALISVDNKYDQCGYISVNKVIDFNNAVMYLNHLMLSATKTEVYEKNIYNCSELRVHIFCFKEIPNSKQNQNLFFTPDNSNDSFSRLSMLNNHDEENESSEENINPKKRARTGEYTFNPKKS